MVQNNTPLSQSPFLGVPSGGTPHDEPDGHTSPPQSGGANALRDYNGQPAEWSGDWQVEQPNRHPGGNADVHNVRNRTNRRHG